MRKLVVLVGPSGSGKTTFRRQHSEWAVICKDEIRRSVFHRDFDLSYEPAVDRIFSATLVEAVESPAEVVCIDNMNLTRQERRDLLEVAHLSRREPIAYVMPVLPWETLYERKQAQLRVLAQERPDLVIGGFARERYERIYRSFEPVEEDEGFARVFTDVPAEPVPQPVRPKRRTRQARSRVPELRPLPLFAG
jgi:protein phosphatase